MIGDKDIDRIKGNIKIMIDKGAPDKDIDGYLAEEGVNLDTLTKPTQATTPVATGDAADMNVYEKSMAGLGGGTLMALQGLKQLVAKMASPIRSAAGMPQILPQINREGTAMREDLKRLTDQSTAAKIGAFTGETLPSLAIPGGVAGKLPMRMLTGAASGAAQGATRFTGEKESTGMNALIGGLFGGAIPAAVAPIGKAVNAVMGKANITPTRALAESKGIPTTLGEDIGNPHLQRVETFMERIPLIGTMGFRKTQHEAAEKSANDYLGSFVLGDTNKTRGMLESNRGYVSNLYEKVKGNVKGFEDLKAYALDTANASNEILDTFPQFWEKFGNKKVLSMVNDFKGGAGKIHTFDDLWELRKGVGDIVGQLKAMLQNGGVSKEQYSLVSKMYSAINSDMDKFAESVGKPEISTAMKSANEAYKQFVVKYNIMDRAMDKSAGAIEDTGKLFSPQKFHSALDNILKKEKYNNLFTVAEKKEMAGLANIMTTVKRSGQFMENPPTGNRMIDVAIGGGAMGSFFNPLAAKTMATTGATVGIMRFLTTTKAGKNFIMSASRIEPSSPAMKSLMDNVYKGASRMATNESLNLMNKR